MARVIFICDGCGKQEDGYFGHNGSAHKPHDWYIRGDDDGVQISCSRECIKTVSEKSGKNSLVMPF